MVTHIAGRNQAKKFRKVQSPIVERMVDCLKFLRRNSGNKVLAIRMLK